MLFLIINKYKDEALLHNSNFNLFSSSIKLKIGIDFIPNKTSTLWPEPQNYNIKCTYKNQQIKATNVNPYAKGI